MSGINNNDSDPSDPSIDPFSKIHILAEIANIIKEMKSGKMFDPTLAIAKVLQDINGLQGNIVSSDAALQTIQSGYIDRTAGLQACVADTDGTLQPGVNPYTGKTTTQMVSPEQAYADRLDYIRNNIHTPYVLDDKGNAIPMKPPTNPPTFQQNKMYKYYNDPSNKSLLDALDSNLASAYSAVSGTTGENNTQTGNAGYQVNPNDGTLIEGTGIHTTLDSGELASPPTTPPTFSRPGVFQNLWNQVKGIAIPPPVPPATEPAPNPAAMQPVQSAMGTLSSTLTSGSSAIQAIAKNDAQNYQTGYGVVNTTLQSIISMIKAFNKLPQNS